ncbi:MAG: YceI family protein [Solirubrobacteraceae bacterium]|jgi:polyisoprenoid-binding protein YceI
MATTADIAITPGTYSRDPIHSSVTFSVRHFGAGRFRGSFQDFDAGLTVDGDDSLVLTGTVKVDSVQVREPQLAGHLKSPEFFDAERYPEFSFRSTRFDVEQDGTLAVDGDLTIKGTTKSIHATGELSYLPDDGYGNERAGVELTTTIDRTDFGIDFAATLPGGQPVVADDVTLNVELELTKPKG